MSRLEEMREYAENAPGRLPSIARQTLLASYCLDLLEVAEAVDEAGPWLNVLVMLSGDDADHEVWRRVQAAWRKLEEVSGEQA